jgi:hypothetical protein
MNRAFQITLCSPPTTHFILFVVPEIKSSLKHETLYLSLPISYKTVTTGLHYTVRYENRACTKSRHWDPLSCYVLLAASFSFLFQTFLTLRIILLP